MYYTSKEMWREMHEKRLASVANAHQTSKAKKFMKKFALYIVSVIVVVMLGFNVYYTCEASKECRVVRTMAQNMQEQGVISNETLRSVYRQTQRAYSWAYPVNTLARLQRIHRSLQRELDEHNARSMKNIEVCVSYRMLSK